jgi:F-type H+-transporting ATPase subunit delta
MNYSLVAARYANALYKLSIEKDVLEEVYNDIRLLLSHCASESEFCEFVYSPIIKPGKKKDLFRSVYSENVNPITTGLFNLVVENNREVILKSIFRNFSALYKQHKGIKTVTLYTAFKMDDNYLESIREFLAKELKTTIELNMILKEDLLGGFILKVDDRMVDASIAGKLKRVRNQLING